MQSCLMRIHLYFGSLADNCFITVSLAASRPVCVMCGQQAISQHRPDLPQHHTLLPRNVTHSTIAKLKLPVSCLIILYIILFDLFLYIYSVQSISTVYSFY